MRSDTTHPGERSPETARPVFGDLLLVGVSMVAISAAAPALAQSNAAADRERGATITRNVDDAANPSGEADPQRVDESYQARGMEWGQFLFFPLLDVSASYNSNIFATRDDAKGDTITRIAPEFRLRSRFKEHSLNFRGRLEQFVYLDYTDDNRLDGSLQVDGRYDVRRTWEINFYADANQQHEDRGSPDAAGGLEPTRTRNATARVSTKADMGRYGIQSEVAVQRRKFFSTPAANETGRIEQGFRDRTELSAMLRGSYEIFPGYSAVVEGTADTRNYDDERDRAGFDRSSEGATFRAGIGVDISQVIRGDFLVGYLKQNYDDPRLSDPTGLSLKASFNWTPSRMTVVVPSLERSVYETTTSGASGMVRTGGTLTVRHELQRNLVVTGVGSVFFDTFKGSVREDWTYDTRVRALYSLSDNYYIGGEVGYRKRTSDTRSQGFDQTVVLLRVGFQI
ncbi:MAG: hypothetical protein RLY86_636 [Pseudomonadota bacterium]